MRNRSFLAVAVILALSPVNLAWGQANLPNNANAATVQGPDPTGMLGYPLATVPATGALPWPVAIQSFAASLCVTQCTSPWIVAGSKTPSDAFSNPTDAVPSQSFGMLWDGTSQWARTRQAPPGVRTVTTAGVPGAVMMVQHGGSGADFWNVISAGAGQHTGGAQVPMSSMALYSGSDFSSVGSADSDGGFSSNILASCPEVLTAVGGGGSATFSRTRSPGTFKVIATAAAGNTALWTPAAGRRFRLMRWRYTVTGSAATLGGADIVVALFDGAAGVTGQQDTVTVPGAATTLQGQLAASPWVDIGQGYRSTALNNVLNVNLSAALTAGTVTVEAVGTEEN